jgi:hypothetical protein
MGELPVHHYGPMSHPMSCKHTHTNHYFNSGSYHHPSDKQAVTSVDAHSLVLLQSTHDESTSSSQLLSPPEQEREKGQQAHKADDTDDEDTSLQQTQVTFITS